MKKIICSFGYLLSNELVGMVSGLISGIIMARMLGPEKNGIYSYTVTFASFFMGLSMMGTDTIMVKELNNKEKRQGEVLYSTVELLGFGGGLAFLLSVLSAFFLGLSKEYILYVFILSAQYLFSPLLIIKYWKIATSDLNKYSVVQNRLKICMAILKCFIVIFFKSLFGFVLITGIESCLTLLILLIMKAGMPCLEKNTKIERLHYIKVCFPLVISSIAITIYMKIDQIMIGNYLGESELGIYSVAVRIAEIWYFVPAIMFMVTLPHMTKAYMDNKKVFYDMLQKYADVMVFLSYVVIALVYWLGRMAIQFMYGDAYIGAYRILIVYIWAGVFISIGYVFSFIYTIGEHSLQSFYKSFLGGVLNVGINFLLIPHFGAIGATLATLLVQFFSCVIYNVILGIWIEEMRESITVLFRALFPFVRVTGFVMNYIKGIKGKQDD